MTLGMELFKSFSHDACGSRRIYCVIKWRYGLVFLGAEENIIILPGAKFILASNLARSSVASSLKTSRLSDQLIIVRKLLKNGMT